MTKAFLDACILYPPLVRSLILSFARAGAFRPVWSTRVLEEWRRAVASKQGDAEAQHAEDAAQRMNAAFPDAMVDFDESLLADIQLPDPDDRHVLAACVEGGADTLVTFNLKDFPARATSRFDVDVRHPDSFLWEHFSGSPDRHASIVMSVLREFDVAPDRARAALKRARLPRLGKAVSSGL